MSKKRLFCVSDIHGFYDEFIDALNKTGFEKDNKEHLLIVCGDCFDRGSKPIEVMNYLSSLSNKVLIKGNHETLFTQLCKKEYPDSYDFSNGTYQTINIIGNTFADGKSSTYKNALTAVKPFFDSMLDYYETKNYVFVHAYIPVKQVWNNMTCSYIYKNIDWRNATEEQWEEARWLNPFEVSKYCAINDKKIVCGHWHCSAGWAKTLNTSEFGRYAVWEPFQDKNIIAIDRCTAYTSEVNILILEDALMS